MVCCIEFIQSLSFQPVIKVSHLPSTSSEQANDHFLDNFSASGLYNSIQHVYHGSGLFTKYFTYSLYSLTVLSSVSHCMYIYNLYLVIGPLLPKAMYNICSVLYSILGQESNERLRYC